MKTRYLAALAAAALSFALLSGCTQTEPPAGEEGSAPAVPEQKETMIPVETARARVGEIALPKSVSGTILSDSDVPVVPMLPGKVDEVRVKEGEYVAKDQVLFVMNKDDILKQVQPARDAYARTKSIADETLATMRENAENTRILYEAGAASKAQLDQAELQLHTQQTQFESQLDQLKVQLDQAEDSLRDLTVKAPAAGVITSLSVIEGTLASNTQAAAIISKTDTVTASFAVPETIYSIVSEGMPISISVAAASDEAYQSVISSVAPAADPRTGLYTVKAALDNPDGKLAPGLFATASFTTERRENAVLIPSQAILTTSGEQVVYTVADGRAKRAVVTCGITDGVETEILTGISEGDEVVVTGQSYLEDGAAIQVTGGANE